MIRKSIKTLFTTALLVSASMLTGCLTDGNDDEVDVKNFGLSASEVNVSSGPAQVSLKGDIDASKNITSAVITVLDSSKITDKSSLFEITPITLGEKIDLSTGKVTAKTTTPSGTYQVKLTIKAGSVENSKTTKLVVSGGSSASSLTEKVDQKIYHAFSPRKGAYDLVAGDTVSSSANASTDIQDLSTAGSALTGSVKSETTTMFVKSNSFDYAAATSTSIKTAYDAGSPVSAITVATGDILLAKLRNGNYAVIKITEVNTTSTEASNSGSTTPNVGYIKFSYKK